MFSSPRDSGRWPSDRGLTLLELLVAATLSMILIVSVYYVYAISARGYRVQGQMMGAMQQARFGLNQLQRDLSAAGFLATPLSDNDANVCPKPTARLRGIAFRKEGAVAVPVQNSQIAPQQVTIFGSFWSPTLYFTQSVVGNTVTLQGPEDGAPFPASLEEFNLIFRERRFLRLVNADQFEMYLPIASADYTNRTITLSSQVPVATPPDFCGVQGFGVGLEANVTGFVRYTLVADPSEAGKVDLVRQELDGNDPALTRVVAKSTIRVAEYVADLQFYDFTMDVDRVGRQPTIQQFATLDDVANSGTQLLDLSVGARPQDLRFVTAKLTTRTRDEDESFTFISRTALDQPLDSYEVDADMVGAAHTVTLAARVGLPAFQVRNTK